MHRLQTGVALENEARLNGPVLSLSVKLLLHLAPRLGFDGERGSRPGEQARNADGLAGLLAPAVRAVVYALLAMIGIKPEYFTHQSG